MSDLFTSDSATNAAEFTVSEISNALKRTVEDAFGNVRSCNLSSRVLGNVIEQEWAEIYKDPYPTDFRTQLPEICVGCAYEKSCNGGCKESAQATFGDLRHLEPFIHFARKGA